MKILLIGEIYSSNLGDQLVCETTKYLVSKYVPISNIFYLDIMLRENKNNKNVSDEKTLFNIIKNKISINNVIKQYIKKIILKKKYEICINKINPDIVIFTGGQLLSTTFYTYLNAMFEVLNNKKIPIYFNSVGIGKLSNKAKKTYINILSSKNIFKITCRCSSNRIIDAFNLNKDLVEETFDSGILCDKIVNVNRENINECVGLGIMYSNRIPEEIIINFWTKIISELLIQDISFKLFTTGSQQDNVLANKIIKKNKLSKEYVYTYPKTIVDMISQISTFKIILSFRLHSHIVAYSLGIISIGIIWDNKIIDFFHKINRDKYCFSINEDYQKIIETIKYCLYLKQYNDKKIICNKLITEKIFENNIQKIIHLMK